MDSDASPCQVCGRADSRPFWAGDGMRLVACPDCGLVYMDPMPAAEALQAFYDDLYHGASESYFTKVEKKMRRSRHRMRRLGRHAPGGRFLDIGCNGGFMVEAAREQGYETVGIDLDPVSVAYAREHYPENAYFQGTAEAFLEAGAASESDLAFDAVYCSEVIEHIPDAAGFVATVARLMKPGAVLYLTTPDISHWRRPRRVEAWDGFTPPAHCVFFNPGNLRRLLATHGLQVFRRFLAWKPGIKLLARKR